jgi:hypothetical protein
MTLHGWDKMSREDEYIKLIVINEEKITLKSY